MLVSIVQVKIQRRFPSGGKLNVLPYEAGDGQMLANC